MARCTRPDIAFAAHRSTRRTHSPTISDWKLAKRISRYLLGTKQLKLRMDDQVSSSGRLEIVGFSDADFAADRVDRKSVTGGLITLNGIPISWTCKKQGGVSLSTMEAEYTAASIVGKEMLGVKELIGELGLELVMPMTLMVDNQAAIKQLSGDKASAKAKHIDVRIKFISDCARKGTIVPEYRESVNMPADLLTKTLAAPRLDELRGLVGLR